jgi:hypothetical protein
MRRKKVDGLVLDLTNIEEGMVDIDALLVPTAPKEPVGPKERTVPNTDYLAIFENMCYGMCSSCGRGIYGDKKLWDGMVVCGYCHTRLREEGYSKEFNDYLAAVYGSGCTFCGQTRGRFHLDHINMFNKKNSVCDMLDRGCTEADIREEIGKCQLLCIACHAIVTRYEQRAGFHKRKTALTRIKNKHGEVSEAYKQLQSELCAKYEEIMGAVYPRMRALARGVPNGKV